MPDEAQEVPQQYALTIVLGAGASKEIGMPVGDELTTHIINALKFERNKRGLSHPEHAELLHAINALSANSGGQLPMGDVDRAINRLKAGLPLAASIDNFIDCHRGNNVIAMIGKIAITHCILREEQKSLLYVSPENINNQINFTAVAPTWYVALFKLITQNVDIGRLAEQLDKICVITFNYDRSFEHFMFNALKAYYGINDQIAAEMVRHLKIHHPYGAVGQLPWMNNGSGIGYGDSCNASQITVVSTGIKTFTEGTSVAESHILAIRQAVKNPHKLLFLGFAFHRLNMDLLYLDKSLQGNDQQQAWTKVFGTAYRFSESDIEETSTDLCIRGSYIQGHIKLANLTSEQMFNHYSKSLTI